MPSADAPHATARVPACQLAFESGEALVSALLHRAVPGAERDLVIVLLGAPGRPIDPESPLADALTPHGIDVLRFNYRGTWGNHGSFRVSDSVADLSAAIDHVTTTLARDDAALRTTRIHVVGHSYGAAVGLLGAMDDERVSGVAALAAIDFAQIADEYLVAGSAALVELAESARWASETGFAHQDPAIYSQDIVTNRDRFAFVPRAAALLDRRLLFVMALDDTNCPPERHFIPLYRTLRQLGHPHLDAEVLAADHDFTGRWSAVFARIVDWIIAGRRTPGHERA